jgi:hypothetical protein
MSDFSRNQNGPHKGMSLAEMAKAAAQKSSTTRPPPVAPYAGSSAYPPPPAPSFAPAAFAPTVQSYRPPPPSIAPPSLGSPDPGQFSRRPRNPPSLAPATMSHRRADAYPEFRPKKRGGGAFMGIAIALAGIGGAYAIVAQKGGDPMAAVKKLIADFRPPEAAPTATPFSLTQETEPKTSPVAPGNAQGSRPAGIQISALPTATVATASPSTTPTTVNPEPPKAKAAPIPPPQPQVQQPQAVAVKAAPLPKPEKAPVAAPQEKAAPEPPPPAEPAGPPGLVGAIKKAAGPLEPTSAPKEVEATPVKLSNGEIPEMPAQGAIQGALGAQRGAARACMDGQSAPSRAAVVFGSNGKVQSVTVAGPAAGTGAESCIRKALSKASVGPFSRPTFQVSLTITPP